MKKTKTAPKMVMAARREDSNGYGHLRLSFYQGEHVSGYCSKPFLSLRWQCDAENVGWYGFGAEIERDGVESMLEAVRLAGSLLAKISNLKRNSPEEVVATIRAPHWVEDDRISAWAPVEDVARPELGRWMSWTDGNCSCSALASDEESAKMALLKEFAARVADDGSYTAVRLEAWLAAGKPVKLDHYSRCPDTTPLVELLKPFKAIAAETAVA